MAGQYNTLIDLTGQKFGKLTVIKEAPRRAGKRFWLCACDCGKTKEVFMSSLTSGSTRGHCVHQKKPSHHGMSRSYIYGIWSAMRSRCNAPSDKAYKNYGARGITVCDRWMKSFENFLVDMGERPSKEYSLERINNDGPYSPENCKWATRHDQNRNNRKTVFITWKNQTLCIADWAQKLGMTPCTLAYRLKKWSLEKALSLPVKKHRSPKKKTND